jgi:hypothetical protein
VSFCSWSSSCLLAINVVTEFNVKKKKLHLGAACHIRTQENKFYRDGNIVGVTRGDASRHAFDGIQLRSHVRDVARRAAR